MSLNATTREDPKQLKRRRWQLFFVLTLFIWLALTAISTTWNLNDRTAELNQAKRQEVQALAIYLHSLADSLDHVFSDLRWLPHQNELQAWLQSPSANHLDRIADEYHALLTSKPIYDHICFISREGQEVVRINFADGDSQRVPKEELRSVRDSYFVQKALQLGPGEVYLSRVDLKRQNDTILLPYKPLLRFMTPVFDRQGLRQGVVMLSYNATEMIGDLLTAATGYPGELHLLNASGFWLADPRHEREWGYLISERSLDNLKVIKPQLWELMELSDSGQMEDKEGIFTFTTVAPKAYWTKTPGASIAPYLHQAKLVNGADHWILMTHILPSSLDTLLQHYTLRVSSFIVANTLLAAWLAMLLSQAWLKRRIHRIELEELAFFDHLTGLPNRGNLVQQVENQTRIALRHGHNLALFLIDLDGFKDINDTLGHNGGDQALVEAARRFKSAIRQSDTVARIGGDEFMVLLPHIESSDDAVRVASKILEQLRQPLLIKRRACQLGASIGISLCPQDSSDPETLWHLADMAMYRAKNTGKNRFCFYSCHDGYDLVCKTQGLALK